MIPCTVQQHAWKMHCWLGMWFDLILRGNSEVNRFSLLLFFQKSCFQHLKDIFFVLKDPFVSPDPGTILALDQNKPIRFLMKHLTEMITSEYKKINYSYQKILDIIVATFCQHAISDEHPFFLFLLSDLRGKISTFLFGGKCKWNLSARITAPPSRLLNPAGIYISQK